MPGFTNSLKALADDVILVQAVAPDSIGGELGLLPGTELLAINGRALEDFLDWEFLSADERFLLRARLPTGGGMGYDIERPGGFPIVVTLRPPRIRRCPPPRALRFTGQGIAFHAQVVLVPGVNDGVELERTLADLYGIGSGVLSVSVVPVALTEFSKRHLVREPTPAECRAALGAVDRVATRALVER